VQGFWSVTLYSADGFLVPNDGGVYAIGDRTPGVSAADGSATIGVGHARPSDGHWLPAPEAPFYLMLRMFAPEEAVLDGRWLPPAIERVVM
jgi:hypothetical protein